MRSLLLPACGAAILAAGCFYPADRGRALEARLDKLTADGEQMAKSLEGTQKQLDGTLPRIDTKVAEVTAALERLDKASRRSDADIGVQFQKAVEDMAQLRGQVELYVHRIDELDTSLKKLSTDTEQRLVALQGAEAVRAAEAKKKAEELVRPTDPKQFLELADGKATAKELPVARALYSEFLKKWPRDALVGDAYFGLGETFRVEDKCPEALFEYGKVIQDHAKARSAPDAYLRSAECFKKMKMVDSARLALDELVKAFPKSEAAKAAKAQLAELDKAKKATKAVPPAKKPPPPAGAKGGK